MCLTLLPSFPFRQMGEAHGMCTAEPCFLHRVGGRQTLYGVCEPEHAEAAAIRAAPKAVAVPPLGEVALALAAAVMILCPFVGGNISLEYGESRVIPNPEEKPPALAGRGGVPCVF